MKMTTYTSDDIRRETKTLKAWALKSHKGKRIYFEPVQFRVHDGGTTLVVPFHTSDNDGRHEVGTAL